MSKNTVAKYSSVASCAYFFVEEMLIFFPRDKNIFRIEAAHSKKHIHVAMLQQFVCSNCTEVISFKYLKVCESIHLNTIKCHSELSLNFHIKSQHCFCT